MSHTLSQSLAAPRRLQKTTTIAYFVAFVALGLAYASLGPTLTDLATKVGVDLRQISYALTARGFGYLIGSLVGGRLYDRVRGHPVMSIVLLIISGLLVVIPLSQALWLLVALLFLLGTAQGALDVGGNTLLVWVHGDAVDPYMNAMHFFFGVGAFISPVIVAQSILLAGRFEPAYWVLAVLIVPVAIWVLRLPSPSSAEHLAGASSDGVVRATRKDGRLVALLALFFFLYVGAEGSYGSWIAAYAETTGLGGTISAATAAYLASAFWGALTLGRLISIPLAARFSPRQVLFADLVGCLLSTVLIFAFPSSATAAWVGTFGAGLFMASIFPTCLSLAERYLAMTGTITSLFFVGGSLGGMLIPYAIGQLFERIGPEVTITAIVASLVLASAVFGVIVVHTRGSERRVDGD
jgi:MFS transporter, FHS family, Na+ dependent glucose transporter 1